MSPELHSKSRTGAKQEGNSVKQYLDKKVYTSEGKFVGTVDEVMISLDSSEIRGLGLSNCNTELFKNHSHSVSAIQVPYDWVLALNDVVVVRSIPEEGLRL